MPDLQTQISERFEKVLGQIQRDWQAAGYDADAIDRAIRNELAARQPGNPGASVPPAMKVKGGKVSFSVGVDDSGMDELGKTTFLEAGESVDAE